MYGGLARHELVTADAFALVVCHELGHHLGGAPKVGSASAWASNEGEADYFGTLKCFRRLFESENNEAVIASMAIPTLVKEKCEANFSSIGDQALCMRASMAGKSLALLLSSLGRSGDVDFSTPDTNVVSSTNNAHPAGQCRLDTYFQGSICDKGISEEVSNESELSGTCNRIDNYDDGVRPLCWFKPSNS